jgi:hypothetical protein
MPRPLQRVRLESGLKLNLNRLARRGFIRPGALTPSAGIRWTDNYTGGKIASGLITADMSGNGSGKRLIRPNGRRTRGHPHPKLGQAVPNPYGTMS